MTLEMADALDLSICSMWATFCQGSLATMGSAKPSPTALVDWRRSIFTMPTYRRHQALSCMVGTIAHWVLAIWMWADSLTKS